MSPWQGPTSNLTRVKQVGLAGVLGLRRAQFHPAVPGSGPDLAGDGAVRPATGPTASLHVFLGVAVHLAQSAVAGDHHRSGRTFGRGRPTLAANHLSLLDILVLFRLFKDFKWVSKAEIFKVPLIGWNMSMNRYIRLQRGQRDSVVQMMKQAQQTLESGSSIMMFPEGTRSKSGSCSASRPARSNSHWPPVPVVPIVVSGTHNALPKHGFVLQGRHEIGVHVLAPVDPIGTSEQLCEQVRALIAEQVR